MKYNIGTVIESGMVSSSIDHAKLKGREWDYIQMYVRRRGERDL